jgi:hypothetical protein
MSYVKPLNDEIEALLNLAMDYAEDNDGEIPEWLGNRIDELKDQREIILLQMAQSYKEAQTEMAGVTATIMGLTEREDRLHRKMVRIANIIELYNTERQPLKNGFVELKYSKSERLDLIDEEKIPDEWRNHKVTVTTDKAGLKKAIKNGLECDYAKINTYYNQRIV